MGRSIRAWSQVSTDGGDTCAETDVTLRAEIEYPRRTGRGLESFVELAVDRETAIFVSSRASGPTFIELVLPLDELSLCGGHVGREGE